MMRNLDWVKDLLLPPVIALLVFAGAVGFGGAFALYKSPLEFINSQDFSRETIVVVMGDHLAMSGELQGSLSGGQRNVFFAINSGESREVQLDRPMNHFDVFPTILDAIGLPAENGHAGLGQSLFGKSSSPHFTSIEGFEEELQSRNKFIESLWG